MGSPLVSILKTLFHIFRGLPALSMVGHKPRIKHFPFAEMEY
ncbi:hypothetical protein HMPREF9946_02430 [Acetobacteraceae bacterium AT-5844]|nr:hypothetical protein HMPREF9946_02430 [Acetobacteraceae bacterium AT-5844]